MKAAIFVPFLRIAAKACLWQDERAQSSLYSLFERTKRFLRVAGSAFLLKQKSAKTGETGTLKSAAKAVVFLYLVRFVREGSMVCRSLALCMRVSAARGEGAESILESSLFMRSLESFRIRGTEFFMAVSAALSGEPQSSTARKRKKRKMRKWSSFMRVSGSPIKRKRW